MQMWPVGFSNKVLVFIYIKNSFIFNFVWIMDSIMDRSLVWSWRTTQNHGLMKNRERRPRRCEWELILIFFRIWLVSQIRPQSSETTRGAHTNQLVTRWTLGSITNPAEKERKRNKQESAKNLNSQFKLERSSVHIKPVRYNTCLSGRKSGNPVERCPNIIKFYTQAHNTLRNSPPKFSPKLQGPKYWTVHYAHRWSSMNKLHLEKIDSKTELNQMNSDRPEILQGRSNKCW
jgi:hypothetical protein